MFTAFQPPLAFLARGSASAGEPESNINGFWKKLNFYKESTMSWIDMRALGFNPAG